MAVGKLFQILQCVSFGLHFFCDECRDCLMKMLTTEFEYPISARSAVESKMCFVSMLFKPYIFCG